jgi:hypothetical protein
VRSRERIHFLGRHQERGLFDRGECYVVQLPNPAGPLGSLLQSESQKTSESSSKFVSDPFSIPSKTRRSRKKA